MLTLALGYFAYDKFILDPGRDAQVTTNTVAGLAEVRDLIGNNRYALGYARARELDNSFAEGPLREELWAAVSGTVDITSNPPGAEVWVRPFHTQVNLFCRTAILAIRAQLQWIHSMGSVHRG